MLRNTVKRRSGDDHSPHDRPGAPSIDRRRFVAGAAAAGLGVLASSTGRATADTPPVAKGGLIDVHHHFVPPFYVAENRERITASGGGRIHPAWLSWSPEQAIAAMDKQRVATAILSLTTPGVWFGDPQTATQRARRANEYAADLVQRHPGRFGLFSAPAASTSRLTRVLPSRLRSRLISMVIRGRN